MSHPIKFVLLSLTGVVVLCAQHNRTIITKSEHHKSHRLTRPPKAADLAPPPRPLLTKGADIIFSGTVAGSLGQIYWSTHQFKHCGKLSAYHGDRVTTIVLYNADTECARSSPPPQEEDLLWEAALNHHITESLTLSDRGAASRHGHSTAPPSSGT